MASKVFFKLYIKIYSFPAVCLLIHKDDISTWISLVAFMPIFWYNKHHRYHLTKPNGSVKLEKK